MRQFWKFIGLILLLVSVAACGAAENEPREAETALPTAMDVEIVPTGDTLADNEAIVVEVETSVTQDEVLVTANGSLVDGCTKIEDIQQEREGNTFVITLVTDRLEDQPCDQTLQPFQQQFALQAEDLPDGTYAVNVNGRSTRFVVDRNNQTEPTPTAEAVNTPEQQQPADEQASATEEGVLIDRVDIYLVALEDLERGNIEVGCGDSLVPVSVDVEPTIAPLRAALQSLLAIDERRYEQTGLYTALHQSDLVVEGISVSDGQVEINLSGNLVVGGACDIPRVESQLEQTALQFETVEGVQFNLDGQPLSQALSLRGE